MSVDPPSRRRHRLERVRQLLFRQAIPPGLMSWRYLAGDPTPRQRIHRLLLRRCRPGRHGIVNASLNAWLWLRWTLFSAWYHAAMAVRRHGAYAEADAGIGRLRQFREVLQLALIHTVPPGGYYRFRLYLPERRHRLWHYVHDNEIAAFHRWRDGDANERQERHRRVLSDKHRFARALRDVPLALAGGRLLPTGASHRQIDAATGGVVFCKPRVGSRAIGAFRLRWDDDEVPEIRQLDDTILRGDEARCYIDARFAERDYLVQDHCENHAELRALEPAADEPVSLRIITERAREGFVPYCAYLEVPRRTAAGKAYYALQVDVGSGTIVAHGLDHLQHRHGPQLAQLSAAADGLRVPHWRRSLCGVLAAHERLDAIHAIAWDLIVTPDGPVLLEGNATWRIDLPQQLCGGLLETVERTR